MPTEIKTLMNQKAISYGLIGGIIVIALNLLIYLIDPALLANWWVGLASLPIVIIILIMGGLAIRKAEGGYITFGKAFLNMFVIGIVMAVLSTINQVLLFHVIDPELPQFIMEKSMENMAEMMSNFGMPEAQLEQAMSEAAASMEGQFSVGKQILGVIWGSVFYAVLALILALIVKRNPENA